MGSARLCGANLQKCFVISLCSHTVNLLTNMPADSYEELLTPLNEDEEGNLLGLEDRDGNIVGNKKQTEYDDKNVQAIVSLLEFLDKRLDKVQIVAIMTTICKSWQIRLFRAKRSGQLCLVLNTDAVLSSVTAKEKLFFLFQPQKSIKESLTPILHCLCETCRSNRTIRKFCRSKVR